MLPIDPLLSVTWRGVWVTAHISSLVVICLMAGGVVSTTDAPSSGVVSWGVGTIAVLAAVFGTIGVRAVTEYCGCVRLGGRVRRIHLLCFGSVLVAAGDRTPRNEAIIGTAGLVPMLLLGASIAAAVALDNHHRPANATVSATIVAAGAIATVQILPGLGLSGGRVLRALVWYLTDNAVTGARAAAAYAYLLGTGLMALGLGLIGLGGPRPYWGLWAIVAGWQLSATARRDVSVTRRNTMAGARTLADVIFPLTRIAHAATIGTAIEPLLAAGPHAPLLVTGDDGLPLGILRLEDLRGTRRADWDHLPVSTVAVALTSLPNLAENAPVSEALEHLEASRAGAVVVTAADDPARPLAVVSAAGILSRLRERRLE